MPSWVVSPDADVRDMVAKDLRSAGKRVRTAEDWGGIEPARDGAHDPVLLVAPAFRPSRGWQREISVFRALRPLTPLVLMVDVPNPSDLSDLVPGSYEVSLSSEVSGAEIRAALDSAVLKSVLTEVILRVQRAERLPALQRGALTLLLRAEPPLRSVAELCELLRCGPRSLQRSWPAARSELGIREGVRFGDLRAAVFFLHACAQHRMAAGTATPRSWPHVAAGMSVHPNTLGRRCRQVFGVGLGDLAAWSAEKTMVRFSAWLWG